MKFFTISALATGMALSFRALAAPTISDAPLKIDRYVELNETTDNSLVSRGGNHGADFYSSLNCVASSYIKSADANFGCGGTCYEFPSGAQSVQLSQQTTSGDHPTGSMFYNSGCSGGSQSVGIFSGSNTGCSNDAMQQEGFAWHSAYVYYGC